jgi:BirA family biotin operon repressor/biotin-[acetyl-CoA-carboxylase] ligase
MEHIIGGKIIHLASADSTNNYANRQIREREVSEGTVFLTYEQTSGRGQLKNFWESEPGKNLTFSIVVYPDFLEIRHQFMLSKVVVLGIYKALCKYVDHLKVKWPNDIYVGNQKLGGILIENSIMYGLLKSSVIGIGLNINQTVFKSNAPNPVSLQNLTNKHYDCETILSEVLSGINGYYILLRDGEEAEIDMEYISHLYRLNETCYYRSENGVFEGQIIGVNEIGQLLIRRSDGKILDFHFKEVEFLQQI